MFLRHIEFTCKTEKTNELRTLYTRDILPILRRQNGFVDTMLFVNENKPDTLLAISLWKTKNDAEMYHKTDFPKIMDLLKPHLKGTPTIENYNVEYSTMHKDLVVAA